AFGDPPGSLLQQPPHLLRLGPRHLFEILLPEQLLGAVTARARGEFAVLPVAVELRAVETECVRPRLGAPRRQWQSAATAGDDPGGSARVRRRPEDVESRLEGRNVLLATHEHGAQRVADIGLL